MFRGIFFLGCRSAGVRRCVGHSCSCRREARPLHHSCRCGRWGRCDRRGRCAEVFLHDVFDPDAKRNEQMNPVRCRVCRANWRSRW